MGGEASFRIVHGNREENNSCSRSSQQAKPTSVIIPAPPPVTQKHLQGTQDNPLGNSPHPPVTQDDPGGFGGRACITQGGVASGNAGPLWESTLDKL
ncbi:MAG: hypothetical protein D3918_13205 [Candidatus Electrothrix sp. AX2]|nr:hypothetical protein [Candidatus Electrothrix gigas]